jgi:hypothetical protein
MSLGLTKPGVPGALKVYPAKHSRAGQMIEPIGHLKDGTVVWPMFGAAPDADDPDDDTFTGSGGRDDDEDDEEDDDEEDDEPKGKKRPVKKAAPKKDEDDEDEDEDKLTRPERQAARYRTRLRVQERENAELKARLQALEDKDKPKDEVAKRDADEARSKAEKLESKARQLTLENAFFRANQVDWVDPADALKLVDLEDVDVDEDGTVDPVQLRKALRALAKAKPHLVKKIDTKGSAQDDDSDDEDEDDEPRSRQSASTMNRQRRGTKGKAPSRQELAKKFPVLNRL